jgi:serine protease Do
MHAFRRLCALWLLAWAGQALAQASALPDFTRLVQQQGPAVVNISTRQALRRAALQQIPGIEDEELREFLRRFLQRSPEDAPRAERRSLGSGFFISSDGYILTNAHVIEGADEIDVRLTDKREFKARVIGVDRRSDVALIKIAASGLPVVRFGDPAALKVGEWVVAIGSPFGFDNTVTAGIVSAKGRLLPEENLVPFIQTDVAINPGNSGGPLFNLNGEVIGINSQIYSRTGGFMGLSFAIPIDLALDIQKQLRESGRVSRGRIGVVIQEVTKGLADSFALDRPRGALVDAVDKTGPAARAGVEPSDIITRFAGRPVQSSSDLPRLVAATRPGTTTQLEVWRNGATRSLTITVGEIRDVRAVARQAPRAEKPADPAPNRLGIAVSELSPEQKKSLGVDHGLVVTDVRPEARGGELRRGDILLRVVQHGRQTELTSPAQLVKLLAGLDRDAAITFYVRRGERASFVTIAGFADKG